jgi:S1-C subfamily serine protease
MRERRVWMFVVLFLLLYAGVFAATDWATAVVGLDKRVVRLEMVSDSGDTGVCSGIVLNEKSGYVLTAQHCIDGKLAAVTVNARHAEVVRQNKLLDLAVLRTELKAVVNMPLASQAPIVGSDVAILGYAWGRKSLYIQFGRVSLPLDEDGALVIDGMAIGGDSGGPTINAAGELVGLTSGVQHNGPMHLSVMVPVEKIREFCEPYLPLGVK